MYKNVELLFVRHAESNANAGFIENGIHPDDQRLSPSGLKQAELLSFRFSEGDISRIYASSLARACQTVEPTAKKLGLKVNVLRELMEVDTEIANSPPEAVKIIAPSSYHSLCDVSKKDIAFPLLNQTDDQCEKRAEYCVNTILSDCSDGDKVLICTHGAFLGYLIRFSLGLGLPEKFNWQIDNCCIFHIKLYSDRVPMLIASNDGSHLFPEYIRNDQRR